MTDIQLKTYEVPYNLYDLGTVMVCTALYCESQHNVARHLAQRFEEGVEWEFCRPYRDVAQQYAKAKYKVSLSGERADAIYFYVNRDLLYRLDVWQSRRERKKCNYFRYIVEVAAILSERRKALKALAAYQDKPAPPPMVEEPAPRSDFPGFLGWLAKDLEHLQNMEDVDSVKISEIQSWSFIYNYCLCCYCIDLTNDELYAISKFLKGRYTTAVEICTGIEQTRESSRDHAMKIMINYARSETQTD